MYSFLPFIIIHINLYISIDALRKMFGRIVYSEKGCNERQREESTYFMFLNYLDKCEKGMLLCLFNREMWGQVNNAILEGWHNLTVYIFSSCNFSLGDDRYGSYIVNSGDDDDLEFTVKEGIVVCKISG